MITVISLTRMAKSCKADGCVTQAWGGGYCKNPRHQLLRTDRSFLLAQQRKKEKQEEQRKTYTAIKKVSDKQKALLAEYAKLRKQFLKAKTKCEAGLYGCFKDATEIHHLAGRGAFLLDTDTWMGICRSCHAKIHDQLGVKDAEDQGLRIRRNTAKVDTT